MLPLSEVIASRMVVSSQVHVRDPIPRRQESSRLTVLSGERTDFLPTDTARLPTRARARRRSLFLKFPSRGRGRGRHRRGRGRGRGRRRGRPFRPRHRHRSRGP